PVTDDLPKKITPLTGASTSPQAHTSPVTSEVSAVTALVRRVGQAAILKGRPPQRMPFSLRMRARSRRWAARTSG
ncbi:hypothetical protein ACWDDN_43790, partial [Streptomyces griseoruber]